MRLSEFIRTRREAIIDRWSGKIAERLGLRLDQRPQLINDMPELLEDLIELLDKPPEAWSSTSARKHARQRIDLGVDIGGLSEEVATVGETIVGLAGEEGAAIELREIAAMCRLLARGSSESVTEYARLRDAQLAQETARHFSFIAHELRTPLQSAVLAAKLLPPELGPLAGKLERAHRQLLELVDNSLVDARLLSEPVVHKAPVPVGELIDEALENGEGLARQRGISLRPVYEEDAVIDADRRVIASAVTNLVINGIKFSEPGGEVVVRVRTVDERTLVEVSDACGGLPADVVPKLFQPFVQVGSDRSGFGLGLMIVKQAVEAHGGAVRVVNKDGRGCCFVLDLPTRRSRVSQAEQRSSE